IRASGARNRLSNFFDRGRRWSGRGGVTLIAETGGDQLTELRDRLLCVRPFGDKHYFVAAAHFEGHERSDAASVRETLAKLKPDFALETLGHTGEDRRGARVQTSGIRDDDRIRGDGLAACSGGGGRPNETKSKQRIGTGLDHARRSLDHARQITVGQDNLRQQAPRLGRDLVEIKFDERSRNFDLVSYFHPRSKSSAFQGH